MKKLTTILVSVAVIAVVGLIAYFAFSGKSIFSQGETTNVDQQVVKAVEGKQEVVLVAAYVEGIQEGSYEGNKFFGLTIPGTERAKFLKYHFTAKLGIDGATTDIEPTGAHQYTVVIPRFEFLGHNNFGYDVAMEKNGVLSWASPEVKESDLVSEVLNPDSEQQYVTRNDALLRAQAQTFYNDIITSIDPEAKVTYKFYDDVTK